MFGIQVAEKEYVMFKGVNVRIKHDIVLLVRYGLGGSYRVGLVLLGIA